MLVLSRQKGQEILVGDDIRIVVLSIRGDKIRLGIEAPREVVIMREEIIGRDEPKQKDGTLHGR